MTLRPRNIPPEIASLCEAPIAFHRALVVPAGGALSALFLSQALYWTQRTEDEEGWFWKSREDWQSETGMTRTEQETARKNLKRSRVLEERLSGLPATLHFRINLDVLSALLRGEEVSNKLAETLPTGRRETCKQDGGDPANIHAAEITPETTSPPGDTSGIAGPRSVLLEDQTTEPPKDPEEPKPAAPAKKADPPPAPSPAKREKKAKAGELPAGLWQDAIKHMEGLWGGPPPSWPKETVFLSRLLKDGWGLQELTDCYSHFKRQRRFHDQHLSLSFLWNNIRAWRVSRGEGAAPTGEGLAPTVTDEWDRQNEEARDAFRR
jgi:hypothetical protein